MGARPSSFKKGGGFLNNVDGVISGYLFTDEFNGKAFEPGRDPKTKKERFHSLYCVLSVRLDGADEDVTTTLFVGGADDFEVSEDGLTLTPAEEGRELGASTPFALLIQTLCEAGFPEEKLPEDDINFEAIIGTRVRFVQRKNEEATKRLGKRKSAEGKEYDRQDLIVSQVYDVPDGKASKGGGKASKTGSGSGKKGKAEEVDIKEIATEALKAVLEANDGQLTKQKLSVKILTAKGVDKDQKEPVRKWLLDDDNLAELVEEDVITYNAKKGIIALAAE